MRTTHRKWQTMKQAKFRLVKRFVQEQGMAVDVEEVVKEILVVEDLPMQFQHHVVEEFHAIPECLGPRQMAVRIILRHLVSSNSSTESLLGPSARIRVRWDPCDEHCDVKDWGLVPEHRDKVTAVFPAAVTLHQGRLHFFGVDK